MKVLVIDDRKEDRGITYNRRMAEIISGEDKAWELLAGLQSDEVCKRTGAEYDRQTGAYLISAYEAMFSIDPQKKEILALSPGGGIFLGRLRYFFVLSVLWYMAGAVDIQPTGKLVKPSGMPGGDIFFRGSHVLPLENIAKKYGADRAGFLDRGLLRGGRQAEYGDASFELYPFPRIPVTLVLWLADEEWEARADLLFDSSSSAHLPIDVLWSVAMMTLLLFL